MNKIFIVYAVDINARDPVIEVAGVSATFEGALVLQGKTLELYSKERKDKGTFSVIPRTTQYLNRFKLNGLIQATAACPDDTKNCYDGLETGIALLTLDQLYLEVRQ